MPSAIVLALSLSTAMAVNAAEPVEVPGGHGYAAGDANAAEAAERARRQPVELDAVKVEAQREIVSGGTLGTRSDLETPFATHSVGREQIEETQARTIGKLFESEAGVVYKGNTYGMQPFAINVRGLRVDFSNGYKIDGHSFQMYGVELPLELFESVQLLKGATGFLYGIGAPGGTVNYISKKPTHSQNLSLALGHTQDSLFSQHLDVGGRFGKDEVFGYRFNAVNEQGETYNGTELDRQALSLYLDARITPNLYAYVNGFHQTRDLDGGITAFAVNAGGVYAFQGANLPEAASGRRNFTAYDDSYYNSTAHAWAGGLNWSFSRNWSLNLGYSHTFKRIDSRDETLHLRNAAGDYNLALRQLYRPTLVYDSLTTKLEGEFHTGPVRHRVVAGIDLLEHTRDLNIGDPTLNPATSTGGQNHVYPGGTFPRGNLHAPALALVYAGHSPREYFRISNTTTRSAYASDTLGFGDRWSLLLGLRRFDYRNDDYFVSGARRAHYRKKPVTPTVAALFTPREDTTLYASYVESLEGGGLVGNTYVNAGEQLDPVESRQYELGFKTERRNWTLGAAAFRIERGAAYATADNRYVADGSYRYDGVEANGRYRFASGLDVSAGGAWLRARYEDTTAAFRGNRIEAVPRLQGTFGVDHELASVSGLRWHARANLVGRQYVNAANTLQAPGFTTYSVGASYRVPSLDQKLVLRAELNNATDKAYWIAGSNALELGAPRTLNLNVRYDFF